jgi:signal transduction histidine kinase
LNYSPAGTVVAVEWGVDGQAWVAVLDEGPGIAAGESDRVFERFYRGEASREVAGTGLGLSVVEALARRWDGSVRLEGRASGGTRAELRLPLVLEAGEPSPDPLFDDALPGRG